MTGWAARRFWTRATAVPAPTDGPTDAPGFWTVTLDERPLRTPARAALALPSRALARAIAAEWDAQDAQIRPDTMPLTRAANSALDRVTPHRDAVVDHLAAYAETDLLCHRAEAPEALARRQAAAWDPLLDWARTALQAPLVATVGVVPVAQPAPSRARLRAEVAAQDAFALTALHDLVALSGSLVIGLAAQRDLRDPDALWACACLDETWQQQHWGIDPETAAARAARQADFRAALRFHRLSRPGDAPA